MAKRLLGKFDLTVSLYSRDDTDDSLLDADLPKRPKRSYESTTLEEQRRSYTASPPPNRRYSNYGGDLKSPLMQLNELRPGGLNCQVSWRGPPHCPTFVVRMEVDGKIYKGRGGSKQSAKQAAAKKALRSLGLLDAKAPTKEIEPSTTETNQVRENARSRSGRALLEILKGIREKRCHVDES